MSNLRTHNLHPKDENSQPLLYQRLFDRVLAWQKARKRKQITG